MATTTSTIMHKLVQFTLLFQLVLSLVSAAQSDTASDTTASIFSSAQGIQAGGTLIALMALSAGAVVCFAGYKFKRPAVFVEGFMIAGVLASITVEAMFKNQSYVATASWIALMIGGTFGGLAILSMYKLSVFLTGASAGVVLAIMINTSFGYKMCPSEPFVSLAVIAVALGLLCGVLALKLEKPVIVVATSLVGAGLLVWGFGYFAGNFPSPRALKHYAEKNASGHWDYELPSAWWAYMAIILVVSVIGMVVQFHKTACTDESKGKSGVPSRESMQKLPEFTAVETPPKGGYMLFGNPISPA